MVVEAAQAVQNSPPHPAAHSQTPSVEQVPLVLLQLLAQRIFAAATSTGVSQVSPVKSSEQESHVVPCQWPSEPDEKHAHDAVKGIAVEMTVHEPWLPHVDSVHLLLQSAP